MRCSFRFSVINFFLVSLMFVLFCTNTQTVFLVFDFIGQFLPRLKLFFTSRQLWVPTLARLAFFPLLILCVVPPRVFTHDAWSYTFIVLFGLTNGYCAGMSLAGCWMSLLFLFTFCVCSLCLFHCSHTSVCVSVAVSGMMFSTEGVEEQEKETAGAIMVRCLFVCHVCVVFALALLRSVAALCIVQTCVCLCVCRLTAVRLRF